jgi:hypothetical protein
MRCPECRDPLGDRPIFCVRIQNAIDSLKVKCPFQFQGVQCHAHPFRKDLDEHMRTSTAAHLALLDDAQAHAIVPVIALLTDGLTGGVKAAAAHALQHLARTNSNRLTIVRAGAIAPLLVMLNGTDCGTKGALAAAQALRNLAICAEARPVIAEAGALALLAVLGKESTDEFVRVSATWVLVHLSRCRTCQVTIINAGAVSILVMALGRCLTDFGRTDVADEAVLATARALQNLAHNAENVHAIIHAGVLSPLFILLTLGGADRKECAKMAIQVATQVMRTLADLDENGMAMVDAGAVHVLRGILNHRRADSVTKKEVAVLLQKLADVIHRSATAALHTETGGGSNVLIANRLVTKVDRIRQAIGLDETHISGVIEAANEAMGLQPIGGLIRQADALIAVVFG